MPIEISDSSLPRCCQMAAIISAITDAMVAIRTMIVVSFSRERVLPRTALTSERRSLAVWTVSALPGGSAASTACLPCSIEMPGLRVTASSEADEVLPHSLAWSLLFMTMAPGSQP